MSKRVAALHTLPMAPTPPLSSSSMHTLTAIPCYIARIHPLAHKQAHAHTHTHSHQLTRTPTHTHCHALSHTYTLSAQCMSCRQRVLSSFLLFTHTRTCPRHNSCWSWQILYGGIRISLWGTFRRLQLLVSSSSPSSRSDYVYCGCSHYCRTASTAKLACR